MSRTARHTSISSARTIMCTRFTSGRAFVSYDLTKLAGAPNVGISPLAGYATPFNGQQHVDFIGDDGHVHELWFDGAWHHNDLTEAAGAPLARTSSPLDGYVTSNNR